MIKGGAVPIYGGVAHTTILREAGGDVVGVIRALPILQMAGNALRAQSGEHIVCVANRASDACVRAGQWKLRLRRMVERGAIPIQSAVTLGTVLRETGGRVRRIIGSLPVLQMAGYAVRADRRVLIVHMALRAAHAYVRSG